MNNGLEQHVKTTSDSQSFDDDVKHSRRTAMQIIATGAATGLAFNCGGALADSDPVHNLIEAHRRIWKEYNDVLDRYSEDDPRRETLLDVLGDRESDAGIDLVSVAPTTVNGAIALLRYSTELESRGYRWPDSLQVEDDTRRLGKPWSYFLHQNLIETFSKIA